MLRALLVFLNGTALEPEIEKGQLDLTRITIKQPIRGDIVLDHGFLVIVGGVLLCLDRVIEATSHVQYCMWAYLSKSFHHTRQRAREVAVLDGEFCRAAVK